jgi:hypothetical protein
LWHLVASNLLEKARRMCEMARCYHLAADVSPELSPRGRVAPDSLILRCVSLGEPKRMLPIVPHSQVIADDRARRQVSEYADRLKPQPRFKEDAWLSALAVTDIQEAPSLVLDDFNYFAHDLGLGEVQWLAAPSACESLKLAQACWRDRLVRREIVHAVRTQGLRYVVRLTSCWSESDLKTPSSSSSSATAGGAEPRFP